MKRRVVLLLVAVAVCAACGQVRPRTQAPVANAATAPSLRGSTVMVFPVQGGAVPSSDAQLDHWSMDRAALDAEIAYWLPQVAPSTKWVLPDAIDRVIARSPGLAIDPRGLSVGAFQRAQVKRIGDPLFGDLRRLAAVMNAQLALVPVGAEYLGATAATATPAVAAAVINALDGTVIWFGVIAGTETGVDNQGTIAAAAQSLARAFGDRRPPAEGK